MDRLKEQQRFTSRLEAVKVSYYLCNVIHVNILYPDACRRATFVFREWYIYSTLSQKSSHL